MTFEVWLLFVVTEAALCASPGPAVLYTTSQGLAHGFRASVAAALGIVAGNVVYFAASALGLGAVILGSHELFAIVKWCGVAYLVWLGVRMLSGRARSTEGAAGSAVPAGRIWRGGLVVQLANPKNLVFFLAILPPFIDPTGNVALQILVLGVTSQVIEIVTLSAYGAAASGARRRLARSRLAAWADRAAGSLLILVGAGLALIRRADA